MSRTVTVGLDGSPESLAAAEGGSPRSAAARTAAEARQRLVNAALHSGSFPGWRDDAALGGAHSP